MTRDPVHGASARCQRPDETWASLELTVPSHLVEAVAERLAERVLGYRPSYRVGLARSGDGKLRVETSPVQP